MTNDNEMLTHPNQPTTSGPLAHQSSIPSIEYDLRALQQMNPSELLVQICCRLDRHFPRAEDVVLRKAEAAIVREMIQGWAEQLTAAGFTQHAAKVLGVIND